MEFCQPMKAQPSSQPKTIQSHPLDFRAEISSIDEENRTVDLIFTTGADVERMNWWTGERYIERLSTKPESVRLDRLNAGASVLDTHSSWGLSSVLGVVADGTAKMSGGQGTLRARFAKNDPDADAAWNKISQKIVRHVSVGYKTHRVEEIPPKKVGDLPVRVAIDWEPYEVSLVPIPADAGAKLRDSKSLETNSCVIETRTLEETMADEVVEQERKDPPVEPTETDAAVARETKRVQGIITACRAANLSSAFRDKLIGEKIGLEDAQTRVLEELDKRGGATAGPRPGPSGAVEVGEDELAKTRAGITNALLHRANPEKFKLDDGAGQFRSMSLMEIGRHILERRGISTRGVSDKMTLAGMALGFDVRSGSMTTSDFPNILADVFNKVLRNAYDEAPSTWAPLVRRRPVSDFKPINVVQFGDAPALLQVNEHGEFKRGYISDSKETYTLLTWGRVVAITRKALINDDTNAFSRVPSMFGRTARAKESDLVWAQITGNPAMGDGNALFSAAHGNYDSGGTNIGVTGVSAARTAIRKQTSLDGEKLNLTPRFILVPTELETEAEQLVLPVQPAQTSNVNPFQGKLGVIAEARLSAASADAWYLACAASEIDVIELANLEGEEGPMVESRNGFDYDGVEIKCRLDRAAKVTDWRGLYKDVGAT